MPVNSNIITVGIDKDDNYCIWAIVEPEKPMEQRLFELVCTNERLEAPDNCVIEYIGTYQYETHLFEIKSMIEF